MYFDATFYALLAAAFAGSQLIARDAVRLRAAMLAFVGVIGIGFVLALPPLSLVVLAVAVVALLVGCRIIATRGPAATTGLLLIAAGPLLLAWIVGKLASGLGWTRLTPLLFVGASYMLVKGWSLLKDIRDGKTKSPDPVEVTAYFLH